MASRRRKRRDECAGKVRHAERGHAFAAMRKTVSKMIIGRHDAMSVYRCPHCGGWHVGHRPTAQRRTRRKDFL